MTPAVRVGQLVREWRPVGLRHELTLIILNVVSHFVCHAWVLIRDP